jgi:hypothetical protein
VIPTGGVIFNGFALDRDTRSYAFPMAYGTDGTPLGAALRTARLVRGWSLRRLADTTGVPQWRLSAFERGACAPPADEFYRVWECLSTDPPTVSRTATGTGEGPPR